MDIKTAIKLIYEKHLIDDKISSDRFHAILSDYSPEFRKERNILKLAIDDNILSALFSISMDENRLYRQVYLLLEEKGLSDQWIVFILSSFAYALGRVYTQDATKTISDVQESHPVQAEKTLLPENTPSSPNKFPSTTANKTFHSYQIGDSIHFGTYYNYPKYHNRVNYAYERIPIEWVIIAFSGKNALIISKDALDCRQYNSTSGDTTWANCSLRTWLNSAFIKDAFTLQEQTLIVPVSVPADNNPSFTTSQGYRSTDKVFLLSCSEAMTYFSSDYSRQCKVSEYAKQKGAWVDPQSENCRWWLRTLGAFASTASNVSIGGSIYYRGYPVNNTSGAVRPALWINISDYSRSILTKDSYDQSVLLQEIIESKEFIDAKSPITFALGKDSTGQVVISDLGKLPHLLIGGSNKTEISGFLSNLIISMIQKSSPSDLKLVIIGSSNCRLSIFRKLPHLLMPIISSPNNAASTLNKIYDELIDRYKQFNLVGARELTRYNSSVSNPAKRLAKLVIIIDELAELMNSSPNEVEEYICRIAQLGRAAGIHLLIATQHTQSSTITGLIRENIKSRCSFSVKTESDSRVILNSSGAESLVGNGDMLFHPVGIDKPIHLRCAYMSELDTKDVIMLYNERYLQSTRATSPTELLSSTKKDASAAPLVKQTSIAPAISVAPKLGDTIKFGHYPQTSDHKRLPIEWIVVARKNGIICEGCGRALDSNAQFCSSCGSQKHQTRSLFLLLSIYALDCKPYHSKYCSIDWEKSSLRAWLNSEFYNTAFTIDERRLISDTIIKAESNKYHTPAGNDTIDRVFILGLNEVNDILRTKKVRECMPTEYAKAQGVQHMDYFGCYWWLRTPGKHTDQAANVEMGGSIDVKGCYVSHNVYGIRPAIWLIC